MCSWAATGSITKSVLPPRAKRRAREALARVEQVLATSTAAQARAILDLDF